MVLNKYFIPVSKPDISYIDRKVIPMSLHN